MNNQSNIGSADLAHILAKAHDAAAGGIGALSTGEALAAALVLNRPDWLATMGYSIAEAIERIGADWARLVPAAAQQFERDSEEAAYAAAESARQAKLAAHFTQQADGEVIDFSATLVTSGNAPGYRDVSLTLNLRPFGDGLQPHVRVRVRIRPEDGEGVVREITSAHRLAWERSGTGRPLDAKPNEQRPNWIDRQ
jgi:hypothetical protein